MCNFITQLHKKQFTPFSVGLALQFHHEYGSKQLIETLNSCGFCVNYTEVRRFLTSAAHHEISKSQSGLFIPNDICLKISCGGFIQEGSDNVDLNTETIDGKNTFHSMARAVFASDFKPTDRFNQDKTWPRKMSSNK